MSRCLTVGMEPNDLDPASAAALVVRVIDAIDQSTEEQRDRLLLDLIFAAWGRPPAQDQ
jgi:hypothetical protein